jgi:hypothetical protein
MMPATVVQTHAIAVLEDALVGTAIPLPGRVAAEYDFSSDRPVQHQLHSVHLLNQVLIDEQLTTGANGDRIVAPRGA